MPKLDQRGVVHILVPIILILGIIFGVYLITKGPLKLFPKAGGGSISGPVTSFSLSPNLSSIQTGDKLAVQVWVRSDVEESNLFDAKLSFNSDVLSVESIDYSNSFVKNWVEQYSDNASGTISLVGGVPNPGIKTILGSPSFLMAVINFNVLKTSTATLSFTDSSAIYSNANNINILTLRSGIEIPGIIAQTPVPTSIPNSSRVFATSTFYDGNLGGLSGADQKCQARANAANLGGTWKAWLSDGSTSAKSRLFHNTGSYVDLLGHTIANDWGDLVNGDLQNQIEWTEYGSSQQSAWGNTNDWNVWTNTGTPEGGSFEVNVSNTCNNWASNSANYKAIGGSTLKSDYSWTSWLNNYHTCDKTARLYCFEQTGPAPSPTPSPSPTPTPTPVSTPVPGTGDGNGDGKINLIDMSVLLSDFNKPNVFRVGIDMNGDGVINTFDFSLMRNLLIQKGVIRG